MLANLCLTILGLSFISSPAAFAEPESFSSAFESKKSLLAWKTRGDVRIDSTMNRSGKGASLRIGPAGRAVWKLRDENGAGRVEFWIYEDTSAPKEPKKRSAGSLWGIFQKDGKAIMPGSIYAPYLSGDKTYAVADLDPNSSAERPHHRVQYLGLPRAKGWHKWTFDFNAETGLKIIHNDKDVNTRRPRFDWNRTRIEGFIGVIFIGDTTPGAKQVLWVDDLSVTLGPPVKVKPTPPPPPPPVTPDRDPVPEKPVQLVETLRNRHPRVLFTAEDIPAMKTFAQNEGKEFFEKVVGYLPSCKAPDHTKFLRNGTDAQRQGFWRLPTVALHYVLTGDNKSFEHSLGFMKKFMNLPHWEEGRERDSGMGAANIMVGAALAYDWLYHDLDPDFRTAYRKKLLLQARRMYHRGHLNKAKSTGYWQSDPQNNHRWHRDAGLALTVFAIAGDGPEDDWILAKTHEELEYVHRWLPPDGTSHESPTYLVFGSAHLTLALQSSDHCLGTNYLDHPFFKNVPAFRIHTLLPGLKNAFPYGDGGGLAGYNNFLFKCAAHHQLKDHQAGLYRLYKLNPDAFDFSWFSLVWFDPSLKGGKLENLEKTAFFPDLGLAFIRDGWEKDNVAAMFKCGPYGGYKLNEYRNANNFRYINVAHDDPDANSFLISVGGGLIAETSRYSKKKLTRSHNTILVNGIGQRGEGGGWTQPFKRGNKDMTRVGVVTAWKDAGDVVVIEGEAGGSYPDLSRYRRTFIWVKGSYILVLDDIRSAKAERITWLIQAPKLESLDKSSHRYRLKKDETVCDFQIASSTDFASNIAASTADHRGKPLGWQQLQLTRRTKEWRLASIFNPWNHQELSIDMKPVEKGAATINVSGPKFTDTWQWTPAEDSRAPSTLKGERKNGFSVLVDEDSLPPKS